MALGSNSTAGLLPVLSLALVACRIEPPDADGYGSEDTSSSGNGDDLLPITSSTSVGADESTEGHTGSATGSGSDAESTSPGSDSEDTEPWVCGNGIVEGDEACDDEGPSPSCDVDCSLVECGDGLANEAADEECDDSGESPACDADCTLRMCGDATTNATAGEECDDAGPSATCDADCSFIQCGDGTVSDLANEQCDGSDLAGATCETLGLSGGTLGCDGSCQFDMAGCFTCGDGAINPGELCDGGDLGGQTCVGLDFDAGVLSCTSGCNFDTSGCWACGDGATNPGELCDGADLNGSTCLSEGFLGGVLACTPDCASYDTQSCYACDDGLQNGSETDVDCGSACGATCEPGEGCVAGNDCVTHGCNAGTCNDFLSVEATPECSNYAGAPAMLTATAAGGSGSYAYAWTPDDGTLTAPDLAVTGATPAGQQTYTVTVDDGFVTAQDSVMVVNTAPLDLDLGCNVYGANSYTYQLGGTRTCATANTNPGLHLCEGAPLQNVRLRSTLQVTGGGDDDSMGLVWGAQDESHFYSLSWSAGGICGVAGIVVKRVEGPSFAVVGANDVHCPSDTVNSTHLLGPLGTTNQPWVQGFVYDVTIDFTELGSAVTVVRESDGAVIADFFIADTTFTSGYVGATTYSQANACIGPLTAECL